MCWQYGSIPWDKRLLAKALHVDGRTVGTFMEKYQNLTESLQAGSMEVTFPKQQEYAEKLGKSARRSGTEEKRKDEKRVEKSKALVSLPVSVQEQEQVPVSEQESFPSKSGFDPLTYESEITSEKGEKLLYPAESVHKTLLYHFKHNPSEFWIERVRSTKDLARHIDTMFDQMVKDAGEDWQPPAPKQPKTRLVGDPNCRKCRGLGSVTKRIPNRPPAEVEYIDCDCEKHEQIAVGKAWVDKQ